MKTYICEKCGKIIESIDVNENIICPNCGALKENIKIYNNEITDNEIDAVINSIIEDANSIKESLIVNRDDNEKFLHISEDNNCFIRNKDKCINCGQCKKTCEDLTNIKYDLNKCSYPICIGCGQCVINCPNEALEFKENYKEVKRLIDTNEKVIIALLSPAAKASILNYYDLSNENLIENKLIGCLKKIGFDYVFDGGFGNDLFILEETAELIDRLTYKKSLPLLTSFCPAFVNYLQIYNSDLLDNVSKCKIPSVMHSNIIKKYFCDRKGFEINKIVIVNITTCKAEKTLKNCDYDYSISVSELIKLIEEDNIKINLCENKEYDQLVGLSSSSGQLSGVLGGLSESIVRTLYSVLLNKTIKNNEIVFDDLRNINGIKEVSIIINKIKIKIAVVEGMKNFENIIRNDYYKNFHLIEVMNCKNGCIGGTGQDKKTIINSLINKSFLYTNDKKIKNKNSSDNKEIKDVYKNLLIKPYNINNSFLYNENYENKNYLLKK